jgi:phenylacetate-CoA ligase
MHIKSLLKIYANLPPVVQRFVFDMKARQNYKSRYGSSFYENFDELKKLWTAPLEEIQSFQMKRLKEVLFEAFRYSVWYRSKFDASGVTENEIENQPLAVLDRLPFLEKQDVKSHLDAIVSSNPALKASGVNYTSGSTGTPMKTIVSAGATQFSFALWKRFHHTIDIPLFPKSVRFSGNLVKSLSDDQPPFWEYNKYENQLFFSIYHMKEQHLPSYIRKLNDFKPELLDGYPSAIGTLASFILNNNRQLEFTPRAICTTAEPLTDLLREKIEAAFKCKVYNQYSSSEGGVFISECLHANLHIHLDSGYIEFFNEQNEKGQPGEMCEMVITGFRNLKTPLIRYRTGDWVQLPEPQVACPCGSHMPLVSKIFGRIEDLLVDEHGKEHGMVSYRVFKYASHVLKAQLIQKKPGTITVNIVPDGNFTEQDEKFVTGKIKEILGESMQCDINPSAEIATGANGKFKSVIREF